jgi:hypothetical protein
MVLITTSTEIACSPARLRKIVRSSITSVNIQMTRPTSNNHPKQFLDFPRIPQWTQGFIRSITPQTPNKLATSLEAGDKLTVQLEGMSFSPVVLVSLVPTLYRIALALTSLSSGKLRQAVHVARHSPPALLRRPLLPLRS